MKPFKIVWIDDIEENITALKEDLEDWVHDQTNKEYELHLSEKRTYDESVIELIQDPMINLLITDLHLLDDKLGSDLINLVRKNECYKEVLLYSSDAAALRRKITGLDGIYYYAFTSIETLKNKIEAVIHECLYKDNYAVIRHNDYITNK